MLMRTAAALSVIAGLGAGPAQSQTAPNPTQQTATPQQTQQSGVPVFRVTVVARSTPAINYRPRRGDTKIDFVGTPLMPKASGVAEVAGEQGYIEIDARFEDLEPATRFGPEYLTYVLWAVTPEGRANNLGEVQVDDDDAKLRVTTELQAFGLIVTAEPYFAVTQPSDVVVLENAVRDGTDGRVEVVDAKYELLKRGTYLSNYDSREYRVKPLEPGAPLDLAEARNAVALARLAGAERFAADTFAKASGLLAEAELAREKGRRGNSVQMPARQAVQTAEDARLIALQRQEEAYLAQERALAAQREADALARARAEEDRRRAADQDRLAAEAARMAAERERLQAERDRVDAARARADAEAARAQADAARAAAEAQAAQARDAVLRAEQEKAELRQRLQQQLNLILETRETARGLIVNLSDVLFDVDRATLRPGAREKLARVAGVLLAHPGLHVEVEGHADSTGPVGYNQSLSERRASSVRDYLIRQGIDQSAIATSGFGETQPVASNATAVGRQQNRRVELIVSGDVIGTP